LSGGRTLPPRTLSDTFVGTATGKLNDVAGYALDFTFVDQASPG
jgi:hypothetical protein